MGIIVDKTREALVLYQQNREQRPEQMKAAENFAAFMERHNYANDRISRLQGQHMTPGGGKTAAAVLAASVYALVTGKKVIVSTCTRTLRDEYEREFASAQGILRELFPANQPPSVGKWIAFKSIASASIIDKYRKMPSDKVPECEGIPNTAEHIKQFIAWFDAYGDIPILSDWLAEAESYGKYPLGKPESDFSIREETEENAFLSIVRDTRQAAKESNIIITTHALTIMNSLSFGKILQTADTEDEISNVGAFILDEADTLPKVAAGLTSSGISLDDIQDIIQRITSIVDNVELDAAFVDLSARMKTIQKSCVLNAEMFWNIFGPRDEPLMVRLDKALTTSLKALEKDHPNEIFAIDDILYVQTSIKPMVEQFLRPGTMDYGAQLRELTDSKVFVDVMPNGERSFGMKPNYMAHLIRQLWMRGAKQSFTFTSGTLISPMDDPHRPYENFKRAIGADYRRPETDDVWETPLTPDCGKLDRVIYASRTAPNPTGKQQDDGSYVSKDHAEYSAKAIAEASKEGRTLVLFTSNASMQMTKQFLQDMGLADRLVVQGIGQSYLTLIQPYAAKPDAIYLGMNWEGINLRDETGTLIRNLVITKIPYVSSEEFGKYKQNVNQAILKIQQGIGRGLRSKKDRIDLWFLDPRLPFPSPMVKVASENGFSDAQTGAGLAETVSKAFRNVLPRQIIKRKKTTCGVFDGVSGLNEWDVNLYFADDE